MRLFRAGAAGARKQTHRMEAPPALDVPDLRKLLELLTLAAERGAFQISEYEDVGSLVRRLGAFVRASAG